MKRFLILAMVSVCGGGCTTSAESLVAHYSALGDIASQTSSCEVRGQQLIDYLERNADEIRSAVLDDGSATPEEAFAIFDSSIHLHEAMRGCDDLKTTEFKKQLSDIVLLSAEKN